MQPLQTKIEDWKTKLIDLTKRNKLLNFKQTKLSTVHLKQPDIFEIFSALGEGSAECRLVFEEDLFNGCGEDNQLENITLKKNEIYAKTLSEKSHKTLHHLLSKSKASLEEQGINTLFCTFGLCKWIDQREPDKTLLAPLVMIPVQISRKTLTGPYAIAKFEEDIIVNPAFIQQLKELGLDMDTIEQISLNDIEEQKGENDEEDQPVLKQFFDLFSETIKGQKGWEVLQESYLGLFNYHKFVMYKDIESNAELIEQNRFLKAIATGIYEKAEDDDCMIPEIDDLDPQTQFQILDADASQREAIEAVKCAKDLIIQGPPGTGKSQTIVNIISEAIAQNKKILFVSEKQAALNVVKRRLDEHQLGPFCLELHSKMASKDMVYRQFAEILKLLGVETQNKEDFNFEQLRSLQCDLISTLKLFQKPYGQLQITPHQLYNELLALDAIPEVSFTLDDLLIIDSEFLNKARTEFSKIDPEAKARIPLLNTAAPIRFKGFERSSKDTFIRTLRQMLEITDDLLNIADHEIHNNWESEKHRLLSQFEINQRQSKQLQEKCTGTILEKLAPIQDPKGFLPNIQIPPLSQYNRTIDRIKSAVTNVLKDLNALSSQTGSSDLTNHNSFEELDALCDFLSKTKIGILNLDLKRFIRLWHERYPSFFGRLFGGFRKNTNLICGFLRNPENKPEKDIPELLDQAAYIQKLFDTSTVFSDAGVFELIQRIQNHLGELKTAIRDLHEAGSGFIDRLNHQTIPIDLSHDQSCCDGFERLDDWYETVCEYHGKLMELQAQSLDHYQWPKTYSSNQFDGLAFKKDLEDLLEITDHLTEIEDLQNTMANLREMSLEGFIHTIIQKDIPTEQVFPCFKKALYRSLLEYIYSQCPQLYFFKSKDYQRNKEAFKQMDVMQLKNNRVRIAKKRIHLNPKYDFARECDSDLSRLNREIMKKRWKMPIRKLFASIPRLVQMLKPCMLMSPLSVSHFLDSSKIQFDLVVFDEASQVFPEDAVGSIMRAKQVVVVGDNKQLPPTTFFKNTDYDMDRFEDEEDYFAVNLESILDEASVIGIEHKSLLWHYRSRNEQLIHFSNRHFYDDRLVSFPSNHYDDDDYGVYLDYLPHGVYDRGQTRTNPSEVQRIRDIVMAFAKSHPDKSLGIVTFNEAQQDAIIQSIEKARLADQQCEAFFSDNRDEPFFVKNLESVQGDERDVIVFSIGYGKDQTGRMTYNFGPLNREGGERRLNVAVTRAREKIVVVSSITYRDISPDKTHGVKYLREYLMFAEHISKKEPADQKPVENKTAFEADVKRELDQLGYQVDLHVGYSKYKIDLAVKDPTRDGKYILAIECDTSKPLKAKTLRDRERIREAVLENLGWTIMTVWIKDWYDNKQHVLEVIVETIQDLLQKQESTTKTRDIEVAEEIFFIEREDGNSEKNLFEPYEHFILDDFLITIQQNPDLDSLLVHILEKEAPIPFTQLFRIVNQFYEHLRDQTDHLPNIFLEDITEKGNLSRSAIMKRIEGLEENFRFENDFIVHKSKSIRPRKRTADCTVDIDSIFPLEREAMIKSIIQHAAFIHVQDLVFETARQLGYSRTGEKIRAVLQDDIQHLLEKGEIYQEEGKLSVDL